MDYKRNREYFEPVKYGGVIALFIIGSVLLLIGLTNGGNGRILFAIWGILLIALAIVLIVLKKKRVVTDEEYDASVAAMLTGINVKALNKLGLDKDEVKEIAPISFDGYVYSNATHLKKGEDQLWRTNRYESTVLFFSENEVHCYTYTFDTTCAKQTEKTDV